MNNIILDKNYLKEVIIKNHEIIEEYSDLIICSETDTKGRITYVSNGLCKISGYTKEELIGSPHNILRNPTNSKEIFKELWTSLKEGKKYFFKQLSNKRKDGSIYYIKQKILPMVNFKHEIVGYRSLAHDISKEVNLSYEHDLLVANYQSAQTSVNYLQKTLKQKEESLQAFKHKFLSLFTHELKTPLNSIINFSEYIDGVLTRGGGTNPATITKNSRIQ